MENKNYINEEIASTRRQKGNMNKKYSNSDVKSEEYL